METGEDSYNKGKYSAEQMNAFFLEQEQMLDRVERSDTHYQALGVERSATTEEIRLAYLRSMALLDPAQFGIDVTLPDPVVQRIDKAYEAIAQAYSTLVSFKRRAEYNESLRRRVYQSLQPGKPAHTARETGLAPVPNNSDREPLPSSASSSETITVNRLPRQQPVFTKQAAAGAGENRRRSSRFRLLIPVRVTGYDRKSGKWQEMTQTADVSNTGILLRLSRPVRNGTVLFMTLPLPRNLRGHSHFEPSYNVYALVRRVQPTGEGYRIVGVEFLGKHPPAGYLERPWATFRTKRSNNLDRRRVGREQRREQISVEYFAEPVRLIGQETAVTENISSSGLRILVKEAPVEFDYIRIRQPEGGFEGLAAVTDRYVGKDNLERLCLRLLDNEWPTWLDTSSAGPVLEAGDPS